MRSINMNNTGAIPGQFSRKNKINMYNRFKIREKRLLTKLKAKGDVLKERTEVSPSDFVDWDIESIDQSVFFERIVSAILKCEAMNVLTLDDCKFIVREENSIQAKDLMKEDVGNEWVNKLISYGVPFYLVNVLYHCEREQRQKIEFTTVANENCVTTKAGITRFFYCLLILLTISNNAEFRDKGGELYEVQYLPKILKDRFKNYNFHEDIPRVLGIPFEKFNIEWIKTFPYYSLDQTMKNRLSYGIAGYRIPCAFTKMRWNNGTPEEVITLQEKMKAITAKPYSWKVHPAFRSTEFISKYQSLNGRLLEIMSSYGQESTWLVMKGKDQVHEIVNSLEPDDYIPDLDVSDFTGDEIKFDPPEVESAKLTS